MKKLSTYLAGLLMLSACSSEKISEEPAATPDNSPFYITFELSQSFAEDNVSPGTSTRSENLSKEGNEAKITSLVALLVDTDNTGQPTTVEGIGAAAESEIGEPVDGKYNILLNMGIASLYTRRHKYRLFIFANLPDYSSLLGSQGKSIDELGKLPVSVGSCSPADLKADGFKGLPFSTSKSDAAEIQIYLKENTDYPMTSPYVVQADTGKSNPELEEAGILMLTPLHACLAFEGKAGIEAFTYPVGTGAEGEALEVKVQFKKASLVNDVKQAFMLPQGNASDFSLYSPANPGFGSSSSFSINEGKVLYAPEYIPKITDGALLLGQTNHLQLSAILKADDDCVAISPDVRKAITEAPIKKEGSPDLYYYDDGIFQSALTTQDHSADTGWHCIKYDADLQGYAVAYRHAIRHNAGEGKNIDDGAVYPMEYGIVRNYLYQIIISSVSMLPHPYDPSAPVESDKEDINLKINPPAKWIYHRGGHELTFE